MQVNVSQDNVRVVTDKIVVGVEEDRVTIDEGNLVIASPTDGEYHVRAEGFAQISTNTKTAPAPQIVEKDPHWYANGHNGLTLNDSVTRALDTVEDMYERDFGVRGLGADGGSEDDLAEAIKAVIADYDTEGRTTVYRVAGGILAGFREGKYEGVPFTYIFKGVVEGKIHPTKDPAAVSTYKPANFAGIRLGG